jgi:predicted dehydrogenase
MKALRMGVVGAGYMGPLHAQKLELLAQDGEALELVGVCDIKEARAVALGRRHGVPAHQDFRDLLSEVDAMIVAVPTVEHYSVVEAALEAGVDVLVEKPIAATLDEAERLLGLASAGGRVLQVGHLEWFNSAMDVIRNYIRRPRFVEGHRMGPFPDRATDIDVVRDLMIHDLDILQQLLGEEPDRIEAVGVPVVTNCVDIANARLTYPCGCVANLTASRVSATPVRKIRFFQQEGYFSVDFLEQSAVIGRRDAGEDGGPPSISIEKLEVAPGDALLAQLRAFVRATRTRERPRVDGLGGTGALRTALRVNDAMASWGPSD